MRVILNKRGALIYEVLAAVTIIGILSTIVFTSFASMSTNTNKAYDTRMMVEESNRVYNFFSSIENKFIPEQGEYVLANSNDNTFCTTRYTKDLDILLCNDGLNQITRNEYYEINVYFVRYNDKVALNSITSVASEAVISEISTITVNDNNPSLNNNFVRLIIEVKSTTYSKNFAVNRLVQL